MFSRSFKRLKRKMMVGLTATSVMALVPLGPCARPPLVRGLAVSQAVPSTTIDGANAGSIGAPMKAPSVG